MPCLPVFPGRGAGEGWLRYIPQPLLWFGGVWYLFRGSSSWLQVFDHKGRAEIKLIFSDSCFKLVGVGMLRA